MSNININDVAQRIQYTATSLQTVFAVPFPFFSNADLIVYQNSSVIDLGTAPGEYGVSGAGSPSGGSVTLVTGAPVNDIITIIGMLPIDRTSIYSATISQLTGSDLNGDFNREVVMLKQLETMQDILQIQYAPYAEISQDASVTIDRWFPLLGVGQSWRKNNAGTAIEVFDVPEGGLAPSGAKYLVQQSDPDLANAQDLSALASGIMVITTTTGVALSRIFAGTANQLGITNGDGISGDPTYYIVDNAQLPGVEGIKLPTGTTAQRPGAPYAGQFRFNSTLAAVEYWTGSAWDQTSGGLVDTVSGAAGEVDVNNTDPRNPIVLLADAAKIPVAARGFFNGTFVDNPVVAVASDGATITLSLANGGSDLTMVFSTGLYDLDVTPALTRTLTAGTDAVPVKNYIYILESDKPVVTANTTGFPDTVEHAPIATIVCQSAASLQTYGAYSFHQWDDTSSQTSDQGHMTDINHWIRHQPATWLSGVVLTPAVGASTFDIATTSGSLLQLHHHDFPAFDTSSGSSIYIVNDSGTAYTRRTSLTAALTDANGVTMSNTRYNLVIFGVVSQDTGDCQIYGLLPTASYNNDQSAIDDTDRTAVYNIPLAFRGAGFLISRLTMRHVASGNTWSLLQNEDLRALTPGISTGSGSGGIDKVEDDPNPKLANDLNMNGFGLKAADGNILLAFAEAASAVNYMSLTNSATTSPPLFEAKGTDTNVSISWLAKGTGSYIFRGTSDTAAAIKLREDADNGTHSVGLKSNASVTASYDLTFPGNVATISGSSLTYTDAGVASWQEVRTGSWTPVLYESGSEVGDATYNSSFTGGWYSVLNDVVTFGCTFRLTSKGTVTSTNAVQISLPFTVGSSATDRGTAAFYSHGGSSIDMISNTDGSIAVLCTTNTNYMTLVILPTGNGSLESVDFEDIPASFYCQFVGSFRV